MVRGQLTQQNEVPAKTLETQVLGPALPPPFSVALGKYLHPTPQASVSPHGEGFEHEFLEASSQLYHYRISILLTRITGFDTVQPSGSAPQSRGQHLGANKLVPPSSLEGPALWPQPGLSRWSWPSLRGSKTLLAVVSVPARRGLPLALPPGGQTPLPTCWGVEGGVEGPREEGRGRAAGKNQHKLFPTKTALPGWPCFAPPGTARGICQNTQALHNPPILHALRSSSRPSAPP